MKAYAWIAASVLASTAFAQTDTASPVLNGQFSDWRTSPDFRVEINGVEQMGSHEDPFQIVAYHHTEAGKQQLLIIERHKVGTDYVEMSRIVGDGAWLWRFDRKRAEFTAAAYRQQVDLADDRAENAMLTLSDVIARGNSSWALRLIREVYGGISSQYRPWMSTSLLVPSETDPTYRLGANPVRRELRWVLNTENQNKVDAAAYFETSTVRNMARRTAWTMTFKTEWSVDDIPTFAPLPPAEYRNWRALPWARQAAPTN